MKNLYLLLSAMKILGKQLDQLRSRTLLKRWLNVRTKLFKKMVSVLMVGFLVYFLREMFLPQRLPDASTELTRIRKTNGLKDFDYTSLSRRTNATKLQDLTPETGGRPVINVIVTSFRSGSTFMGELVNAFPGTYFHYEPLVSYGVSKLRDDYWGGKAATDLLKMLHCNFDGLDNFLRSVKTVEDRYALFHNYRVWSRYFPAEKYTLDFLSSACKAFPFQVMKVTRLSLKFAEQLLEDRGLNLKIVYLVRDPRGVLKSRWKHAWGNDTPDWSQPDSVCDYMVEDYRAAQQLLQQYPDRFKVVRYEDFTLDVEQQAPNLFHFFGLPFHTRAQKYLESHTREPWSQRIFQKEFSTFRDLETTVFSWTRKLTFGQVAEIQNVCHEAIKLWGYKEVMEEDELKNDFNPLFTLTSDLRVMG